LSKAVAKGDIDIGIILELGKEGAGVFAEENVCTDLEG